MFGAICADAYAKQEAHSKFLEKGSRSVIQQVSLSFLNKSVQTSYRRADWEEILPGKE